MNVPAKRASKGLIAMELSALMAITVQILTNARISASANIPTAQTLQAVIYVRVQLASIFMKESAWTLTNVCLLRFALNFPTVAGRGRAVPSSMPKRLDIVPAA